MPLLVYAFPFLDGLPGGPRVAWAIVIVLVDLGRTTTPPALHSRHAFGLTDTQSKLAALLAGGTDLHAAAQVLGIRKETAHSHLKAIFARTGVQRQSELVALIARLLPAGAGSLDEPDRLSDRQPGREAGVRQADG